MIFEFHNYKAYLLHRLDANDGLGKGGRARLCEAMGCQSAYLSQVLNGSAQLSSEQGDALSRFFGHSDDEAEYFLLLIHSERAGTASLRSFHSRQIEKFLKQRQHLKSRIVVREEISREQQLRYYSTWLYAAVHVATTIPECNTADAVAKRLGISLAEAASALEFLVVCGLVQCKDGRYSTTKSRIHLGHDSNIVSRVHLNWRVRSLFSIERNDLEDFHYSSVVTVSKQDVNVIREKLLQNLESIKEIIRPSPAEEIACLSCDWFRL